MQSSSAVKPKVYLETTIASYLSARPSRDIVVAAHQELTAQWWHQRRHCFQLFVSRLVLDECAQGDRDAAARRSAELKGIPVLGVTEEVADVARQFLDSGAIPSKAAADAFHVAIATVHGMDYLLTWNCRHIANAESARRLAGICEELGYEMPVLCTPEQLMGD